MKSSSPSERAAPSGGAGAWRRAFGLRPGEWLDLVTAARELAIARWKLATADPKQLLAPAPPPLRSVGAAQAEQQVERVRLTIGRMNHRVPWRADCLVQALAARRWLRRLGVETQMTVGVRAGADPFAAHAWLKHGQQVVTGGDATEYVPLVQRGSRADGI